jgi:Mrp family chromosome partitioning ATPase
MVDLNAEMAELWSSLGAPAPGRPHVIQVVAARRGEGTSTIARELAQFAARRAGRKTWLVDMDLVTSAQYQAIAANPESSASWAPAVAASPDGRPSSRSSRRRPRRGRRVAGRQVSFGP